MSDRKETTRQLSKTFMEHYQLNKDKRHYWAKEVTFDYDKKNRTRVDFMRFVPRRNDYAGLRCGVFYCYEVKSSTADFRSPNGHNFYGDYNYYVMPAEVYTVVKGKIPDFVGVLCPAPGGDDLQTVKPAKRQERKRKTLEMLFLMFRSFQRDFQEVEP